MIKFIRRRKETPHKGEQIISESMYLTFLCGFSVFGVQGEVPKDSYPSTASLLLMYSWIISDF
jgi:hypothetical protein